MRIGDLEHFSPGDLVRIRLRRGEQPPRVEALRGQAGLIVATQGSGFNVKFDVLVGGTVHLGIFSLDLEHA
jgi:hypothetical protein